MYRCPQCRTEYTGAVCPRCGVKKPALKFIEASPFQATEPVQAVQPAQKVQAAQTARTVHTEQKPAAACVKAAAHSPEPPTPTPLPEDELRPAADKAATSVQPPAEAAAASAGRPSSAPHSNDKDVSQKEAEDTSRFAQYTDSHLPPPPPRAPKKTGEAEQDKPAEDSSAKQQPTEKKQTKQPALSACSEHKERPSGSSDRQAQGCAQPASSSAKSNKPATDGLGTNKPGTNKPAQGKPGGGRAATAGAKSALSAIGCDKHKMVKAPLPRTFSTDKSGVSEAGMLAAMFGSEAVEALSFAPEGEENILLPGVISYFATGGALRQTGRVLMLLLHGDNRSAAHCSVSTFGRKSWFFLLPLQLITALCIGLTLWLSVGGEGFSFGRILLAGSIVTAPSLLLLTLLTRLVGGICGGRMKLHQAGSLVMTAALPFAAFSLFLPITLLLSASWLLCPIVCGGLTVSAATLYMGVEFIAMTNGKRSMLPFALLLTLFCVFVSLMLRLGTSVLA